MCSCQEAPSASLSQSRTRKYWATVSMVPPDLLMQTTRVCAGTRLPRRASNLSAQTLSAIQSQGPLWPGPSCPGAKARCMARAPKAEPPMPRTSMCLYPLMRGTSGAISLSSLGRKPMVRKGSSPAAHSCASRRAMGPERALNVRAESGVSLWAYARDHSMTWGMGTSLGKRVRPKGARVWAQKTACARPCRFGGTHRSGSSTKDMRPWPRIRAPRPCRLHSPDIAAGWRAGPAALRRLPGGLPAQPANTKGRRHCPHRTKLPFGTSLDMQGRTA